MSNKYYCEKCKKNHNLNSKVGMKHRGIKVVEPKRNTYTYELPDGRVWKRTSIYPIKYGLIYQRGHKRAIDNQIVDYNWILEPSLSKEDIEKQIKTIYDFQEDGNWIEFDMTSYQIVELKIN